MTSGFIQSVAHENNDDFHHVQPDIFTKFHFTIFEDYLMTKLTSREGRLKI
jgi:hypothetical protein